MFHITSRYILKVVIFNILNICTFKIFVYSRLVCCMVKILKAVSRLLEHSHLDYYKASLFGAIYICFCGKTRLLSEYKYLYLLSLSSRLFTS